ncbi:MAG: apolipoprotein N-acyltransferase [Bryobacteraceae bacterium]
MVSGRSINWLLALVSAGLLVLIFPRFSLVWLAPVALTPLLIACMREPRWRARFALGYAAGCVYWFGVCNWIQWTLEHHAGVSSAVAWLLFVLFCLAKAVQMGVFAMLSGALLNNSGITRRFGPPCVAALWVAIEWTHSWTGFEWLNLGNAASGMSVPLRLAPFTGVWGLSFVFALISAVIAVVVMRTQRFASAWLLILPALYLLPEVPAPQRGDSVAVVVQPNLDDETVWSTELLHRVEERMTSLSLALAVPPTELIVWPEAPAPFYDFDTEFVGVLSSMAKTAQAGVLAGVVARGPLNSALLMDKAGAVESRYDKVNLVPFGEFVPWPFGLVTRKVSTEAGDFAAGKFVVVSALGAHRIGTFICYESVFPSYIRKFAAGGAEALFNISNDSWFGKSQARYQHLLIVRMRAVENRRWIVRGTNNGISAVIDPAGRVLRTLPEYQEGAGRLNYRYRQDLTVYTRFGDWFVLLCALAGGAGILVNARALHRRPV